MVDFWKLEKLEDIGGSWGNLGNIEPYIVATQQSTYVNVVRHQSASDVLNAMVTLLTPSD